MKYGIQIGNLPRKKDTKKLTKSLLSIMGAKADQKTIRAALGVFGSMAEIKNVSINSCHLVGEQHDHYPAVEDDYPHDEDGQGEG